MHKSRRYTTRYPVSKQAGVSLVEVLVSLLIFSVGVLGIVGLHAAANRNVGSSQYRAQAAFIADRLVAKYWTDPQAITSDSVRQAMHNLAGKKLPSGSIPEDRYSYDQNTRELRFSVCWSFDQYNASDDNVSCHQTYTRFIGPP